MVCSRAGGRGGRARATSSCNQPLAGRGVVGVTIGPRSRRQSSASTEVRRRVGPHAPERRSEQRRALWPAARPSEPSDRAPRGAEPRWTTNSPRRGASGGAGVQRPAPCLSREPRDHQLDHRVEELADGGRAGSHGGRRSSRSGAGRSPPSRARSPSPTRRTAGTRRARRRRGSRRRGCGGTRPRASSPRRRRPRAARRSPPGSRAPRRCGSTRGARSSARSRSGRRGGSGRRARRAEAAASRMRCSKSAPLCESTAT